MDFASFNTYSSSMGQQNNNDNYNKQFFNSNNNFEVPKVNNLYYGCFLRNPQELGPQIERPKAPFFSYVRK